MTTTFNAFAIRTAALLLLVSATLALTACGGGGDDDTGLQLVALPADAHACPAQPFVGPLPTWCVDAARGAANDPVPPSGKPQ